MSADNISEEDLNEEINDKLNDLWSGMKNKRRELMKNITPNYSRRTDQSQLNSTSNFNSFQSQHNILKLRQKLLQQVSQSKKKDIEIEMLKKAVSQLTNDKKMLILQLKENQKHSENLLLNESSIHNEIRNPDGQTANFSTHKKTKSKGKEFTTIHQQPQSDLCISDNEKLQKLSKKRLIELLRSTSQYRQFVFYYDSHQLSYLRRLQQQHKKNCQHTLSEREKQFWAPTQIFLQIKRINKEEDWKLTEDQIQHLMSRFKFYYQRNYEQKMTKLKKTLDKQIKRLQRQSKNSIPYDLVQVCKAKQRQLMKIQHRARTRSNISK